MSQAPSRADSGYLIMRSLKELYLSIFVLFFRISRWKGRMKASTAAICVSVVEGVLALTVWLWVQTAAHRFIELNLWIVVVCFFVIAGPGDFFLVVRGHGVAFEKEFRGFSRGKRFALYLAAVSTIVVTGVAFYLSVAAYHHTFNLPRN